MCLTYTILYIFQANMPIYGGASRSSTQLPSSEPQVRKDLKFLFRVFKKVKILIVFFKNFYLKLYLSLAGADLDKTKTSKQDLDYLRINLEADSEYVHV